MFKSIYLEDHLNFGFLRYIAIGIALINLSGCANGFAGLRNPSKPSVNAVKTTPFPYFGQESPAAVVTQPASLASTVFRYVGDNAFFCTQAKPRVALDVFSTVTAAIAASYDSAGNATPRSIDLASSFQSILANSNLELSTPTSVAYLESSMAALCENFQGHLSKLDVKNSSSLFEKILDNSKEIALQEMKIAKIEAKQTIDISVDTKDNPESTIDKARIILGLMQSGANLESVAKVLKELRSTQTPKPEPSQEMCKADPALEGCPKVEEDETKPEPTEEMCKADPTLEGCPKVEEGETKPEPTEEICKANPKLEGCVQQDSVTK